jgi:putative CocE/NonD family hydrolase
MRFSRLVLLTAFAAACAPSSKPAASGKVSEFGRYEGYGEPQYSAWVRTSAYVTVRDGTRLAVDIIRPAVDGKPVDAKFPVIWTHSRYHRTSIPIAATSVSRDVSQLKPGQFPEIKRAPDSLTATAPSVVENNPALQRLVKHGYVIVVVQVRGGGASFGRYQGLFSPAETQDAYDVMDWMVKQPWSDGNLGMQGGSYLGITQYMAASTKHPALKAIFPNVAAFSMFDLLYNGGVYQNNMVEHWGILTRILDVGFPEPPVETDENGVLREAALKEHENNWNVITEFRAAKTRDYDVPSFAWTRHEPWAMLPKINESVVAAYHYGGWYDIFAKDETQWFNNWKGPQHLTMGAWSHAGNADSVMRVEQGRITATEQHRWFDRWLKGIQNGVDSGPRIDYALMIDPGKWSWQKADTWPPAGVENVDYFFGPGPSGSIKSVNDGLLAPSKGPEGKDKILVDLATTTGTATRFDNAVGQGLMVYPDLAPNDAKGLTYTTAPLTADLKVVGSPVATLFVTSNQLDGDFYAIVSEIDSTGFSRYVTEGRVRASARDTTTPPFNNMGLPWRRAHKADAKPLVRGQVAELIFDLQPTATVFNAGNRLRVSIVGADTDNTEKPPVRGRPTVELYRDATHPSKIRLPIMKQ